MVGNTQDENMENKEGGAEERPFSIKVLHHVMGPTAANILHKAVKVCIVRGTGL
jgi:hypothetical protein